MSCEDKQQATSLKGKQAATGSEVKPDLNNDTDPLQELANTLAEVFKKLNVSSSSESAAATGHINVKPPSVYSIGHNVKTWLSQFTQYVKLLRVRDDDLKAYLLTMLDQPAYRIVEL